MSESGGEKAIERCIQQESLTLSPPFEHHVNSPCGLELSEHRLLLILRRLHHLDVVVVGVRLATCGGVEGAGKEG
jgi:hypothetical protein